MGGWEERAVAVKLSADNNKYSVYGKTRSLPSRWGMAGFFVCRCEGTPGPATAGPCGEGLFSVVLAGRKPLEGDAREPDFVRLICDGDDRPVGGGCEGRDAIAFRGVVSRQEEFCVLWFGDGGGRFGRAAGAVGHQQCGDE